MRRHELHPCTAAINKAQKNQSKRAKNEALLWLTSTFPKAFDTTTTIHPLKIGIIQDIFDRVDAMEPPGLSRAKLREALVLFTRRIDYLTCLKAREMRVDLDGNPSTQVTEQEAEKATTKITKRVEKSLRNARKTLDYKTLTNYGVRPAAAKMAPSPSAYSPSYASSHQTRNASNSASPHHVASNHESSPHYIERAPMFSSQANNTTPSRPTTVIINKSTRQFDPEAVARLKEKLGLSVTQTEKSKE